MNTQIFTPQSFFKLYSLTMYIDFLSTTIYLNKHKMQFNVIYDDKFWIDVEPFDTLFKTDKHYNSQKKSPKEMIDKAHFHPLDGKDKFPCQSIPGTFVSDEGFYQLLKHASINDDFFEMDLFLQDGIWWDLEQIMSKSILSELEFSPDECIAPQTEFKMTNLSMRVQIKSGPMNFSAIYDGRLLVDPIPIIDCLEMERKYTLKELSKFKVCENDKIWMTEQGIKRLLGFVNEPDDKDIADVYFWLKGSLEPIAQLMKKYQTEYIKYDFVPNAPQNLYEKMRCIYYNHIAK